MIRLFYTLLFYLALPFILARLLFRSRKLPAYRQRWGERLGFYKQAGIMINQPCVVVHGVSVGEVNAAIPLIQRLQEAYPQWKIVITCSTPTGSEQVQKVFSDSSIQHVYLPYDLPGAIKRFFSFAKPDLLIIMETELWPNLIHYASKKDIKVMLANGRLSEKSFLNYQKIQQLSCSMLQSLSVLAAQSKGDAQRFVNLGLRPEQLRVTGSVKFDIELNPKMIAAGKALREKIGARPVFCAGSTREGEEPLVIAAFQAMLKKQPLLLMILVPRHPQRFEEVFDTLRIANLETKKFSQHEEPGWSVTLQTQVLLGDTMGDMQLYYSSADFAFVGGSLVATGCQNIIEPASLGLPVLTGPSLYNFKSSSQILLEGGAMSVVENWQELADSAVSLLENDDKMLQMTKSASKTVAENKGATALLFTLIEELMIS